MSEENYFAKFWGLIPEVDPEDTVQRKDSLQQASQLTALEQVIVQEFYGGEVGRTILPQSPMFISGQQLTYEEMQECTQYGVNFTDAQ